MMNDIRRLHPKKGWENPRLRYLFFELTDCCNLGCKHCGSNCNSGNSTFLETELVTRVFRRVAEEYDPSEIMICLTGGEPMLHPGLFEIIKKGHLLGFAVGITSNGTLIDDVVRRWPERRPEEKGGHRMIILYLIFELTSLLIRVGLCLVFLPFRLMLLPFRILFVRPGRRTGDSNDVFWEGLLIGSLFF